MSESLLAQFDFSLNAVALLFDTAIKSPFPNPVVRCHPARTHKSERPPSRQRYHSVQREAEGPTPTERLQIAVKECWGPVKRLEKVSSRQILSGRVWLPVTRSMWGRGTEQCDEVPGEGC